MKKNYLTFTLCLLASVLVSAAPRYWVGPINGNWNNGDYWSATSGGPGGAGVPGAQDSVIFHVNALINVDVSPTINSLSMGLFPIPFINVRFYTSVPITFTIRNILQIGPSSVLKDSTSADVPFNFIFNGATTASAIINGSWIFEGGTRVSRGNGPTLTAQPGSRVRVVSATGHTGFGGSIIILKDNTSDIISSPSSLQFEIGSSFRLDDNPGGAIPYAAWARDALNPRTPWTEYFDFPGATIFITGNIDGNLRHLANVINYGRLVIDLPQLAADASLALPSGSRIWGYLGILNTNNHTLTLLSDTALSGNVQVELGVIQSGINYGGSLNISGKNTKVALARAPVTAPATSYTLQVSRGFNQTGGNFSLQDADEATGSSILAVRNSLIQTGGTFFTNSTATGPDTKFMVILDDPHVIPDPVSSGRVFSERTIQMSSGTIDNGRGMVTLRVNHSVYFSPFYPDIPNGVKLMSPLTVGKLDLFRGPLTTTDSNMLTVNSPDAETAVQVGTAGTSYINGPFQRRTNSNAVYMFPTGKGNTNPALFVFDSCVVIPATAEPSMYRAQYFNTAYVDTVNLKPPLTGVSTTEYWNIAKISGADAQIKLIVNGRVPGTTNNNALAVARYADGQWVSERGSVLFPGDTLAGSVVSKPLSEFGPFTFGYYPFDSIPPVYINCPSNLNVSTDSISCNALVEFKAESPTNSTLVYKTGSTVITSPYAFKKGTTIVDVTASDNSGTATCSFTVTVNDVQAPAITGVSANPATLSPTDNAFKNVYIDYAVTDNCGPVTTILSVTSNQPPGGNDIDWEIIDGHNVKLRASQLSDDRMYTITITSMDESGNQTVKTVNVTVPKTTVTEKIKLDLKVMPNPSKTYFTLNVRSNSDKPATLQVFDLFGRVKEVRRFYPDATIRLGDNYRPGVYFVKIIQGNAEVYKALVKL